MSGPTQEKLLDKALEYAKLTCEKDAKDYLVLSSGGDARAMLKLLEFASNIDLHVYTFELNEFHTVDISHNARPVLKVLDAIRRSSSIPLLIKPICENELCYIDGGVQANYPLHYCLDNEKCDEVEILGFKNSAVNLKKIDNNSNITDYLNVILRRFLRLYPCQIIMLK